MRKGGGAGRAGGAPSGSGGGGGAVGGGVERGDGAGSEGSGIGVQELRRRRRCGGADAGRRSVEAVRNGAGGGQLEDQGDGEEDSCHAHEEVDQVSLFPFLLLAMKP